MKITVLLKLKAATSSFINDNSSTDMFPKNFLTANREIL